MTFESEGEHVSQDDKKQNATCTLLMLVNAKSTWLACYTHTGVQVQLQYTEIQFINIKCMYICLEY